MEQKLQVLKKYALLVDFIKTLEKYNDSDTLVEIDESKYYVLKKFALDFNASIDDHNIEPTGEEPTGEDPIIEPTGEPTGEIYDEPKIKLISENDFNAAAYIKYGLNQEFGWYENGTSRLGLPMSSNNNITSEQAIMFGDFYWKNNYTANKVIKNGIECVAYEQWTTRGIGFGNLIIDSEVPVFYGMHAWGNGYWENTIVYVNDELYDSYQTLFSNDPPKAIHPLSDYNIINASKANWWLTY